MTIQAIAKQPQVTQAKLTRLPFAFPFLRKGQGNEASSPFTDEQSIHRLLAEREQSGSYLVGFGGLWHGGIHVTEAGAGQALDLDAGVRCIADGEVIAYRIDRTYPISELAVSDSSSPVLLPYSTGFALVRHSMEFPRGSTLTFYSLYMHLMAYDDYANFPARQKPAYWAHQWQVTTNARDRPQAGRFGKMANATQQGLRVRKRYPQGEVIGILPQGARVSLSQQEQGWGQIKAFEGEWLHPPSADEYVAPSAAIGGWIYLGQENGGPVVQEIMPDALFDRVNITASQGVGMPIKAGELIGHLGCYDSLNQTDAGTRLVHIEVFCDDNIKTYIEQSRAWVIKYGPRPESWAELGLSFDPGILRIAPRTTLYLRRGDTFVEGADPLPRKTDVVQVYAFAELGRDKDRQFTEPQIDPLYKRQIKWWHVESANMLHNPIQGWVRESNHKEGGPTREFAQKWIDFKCIDGVHDATHTVFATRQAWIDYVTEADKPDTAARSKLSPLMLKVYDAIYTTGDGKRAACELRSLRNTNRGNYPWRLQTASRLIVKHESEWANPSKWQPLFNEIIKQTGMAAQHEEEQKRINKLVWWDEVKAGVPGFPGAEVFHINPVALIGNFMIVGCSEQCKTDVYEFPTTEGNFLCSKEAFEFVLSSEGYERKPYVPKSGNNRDRSSGVTIGYGYDLGQQSVTQIATDLESIFPPEQIARLQTASGKRADAARELLPSLASIEITKDRAITLATVMKRRYAQYTVNAFPGITKLHPHCQGALLSLVVNRGPGLIDKPGQKTRQHMRAIHSGITSMNLKDVPVQLRAMKVLWDPTSQRGLLTRREKEAELFEKGMNCNCWR